jgi:hypothetical protein
MYYSSGFRGFTCMIYIKVNHNIVIPVWHGTPKPGQFGTSIRQIGTSKRQIGTCVFFFDLTYKTYNSIEPIPNFNHVCSGKDPDHADSKNVIGTTRDYRYVYS